MLEQYITKERIFIEDSVDSWQSSVSIVAQPLIDEQVILPTYVQAIFDEYERTGPYFVIAPGIAMPHSRPENGAKENGLSLVVVRNGINFGCDNDPVKLVVMLAAKDSESHISMLASLAGFLGDEGAVEKTVLADSVETIFNIVKSF